MRGTPAPTCANNRQNRCGNPAFRGAEPCVFDRQVCTTSAGLMVGAAGTGPSRQDLSHTVVEVAGSDREGRGVFGRIAIVNRGEAAMRLIHAVRELTTSGRAICTIALHTAAERRAMFVREADEAVVHRRDAGAGSPYLDHARARARRCATARADAAWVGLGLRRRATRRSPSCASGSASSSSARRPTSMRTPRRQDRRQAARRAGRACRSPPWSGGPVDDRRGRAAAHADAIGYPLMVKARGRRRRARHPHGRRSEAELADAVERAQAEAAAGVRRRDGLHGARRHRRPPRRGAGHRRRPRHASGRVGVRDCSRAAAQPEGDRGVRARRR